MRKEDIRFIECDACGEWEQMPVDMPLRHAQNFELYNRLESGEAEYKCDCGKIVTSYAKICDIED